MYSTANGMNTASVITSCMIFNCASENCVAPIRLAGTCNRYSNNAMPHEINAAIHHGLLVKFFKWPYHAKVMKMFDKINRPAVCTAMGRFDN